MKQRAITLIIIIIAFLSIFSVNYEVFNRLKDSKVFQSEIFSPVKKSSTQDEAGMCDNSSTKSSLDKLATSTINLFRITL